jgi:mycobactin lysine-N-oxygenase
VRHSHAQAPGVERRGDTSPATERRRDTCDLIAVGAGAKAAALAAKVHVLNGLGLGPLTLTIIEATEPAASWSGRNGMTSGEEPLAIPPIKDVGFPYRSRAEFAQAGAAIDSAMMAFTWQQYLIDGGGYARWVNAGSPAVSHGEYGRYLTWVLSRATEGVRLIRGRVTQVELEDAADEWTVAALEGGELNWYSCRALVLTGPGVHRPLPHDRAAAAKIFHCDSKRSELARISMDEHADVAIVGGGESALSCVAFLRTIQAELQLTVYTPMLPLSRGESFLENRVFANPDEVAWSSLDLQTRRDFVKHCDRGVFDPGTLAQLAYDEQCHFIAGRVTHVGAASDGVCVDYTAAQGACSTQHDYLVNCTGFDLLEQLRGLFSPALRAQLERRVGPLWKRPPDAEIAIDRSLALAGMRPRLHIPGLASLSQGPGFANLGSLGLLANRVLQPFVATVAAEQVPAVLGAGRNDRC